MTRYDVFISHASEDKLDVARPLATLLIQAGLTVWIDEAELVLGDSLRRKIDLGLARSTFGAVVLSKAFFAKEWPQKELDALVAREDGRNAGMILPIWHNLDASDVRDFSPLLADRLGIRTDRGIQAVAASILQAVRRDQPRSAAARSQDDASLSVSAQVNARISIAGPKRIDELVNEFIDRVTAAYDGVTEVVGTATGFGDLDRLIGGLTAGELYVVAARPAMGSTTFALNIAAHVAVDEGLPVIYFSPSAGRQEVMNRLIASTGRIDRRHLAAGQLTDEEWKRLADATAAVHKSPMYVDDSPLLDVDRVVEGSRATHADAGAVGLIVVDSLETLAQQPAKSEADTPRVLRQLARELNCSILLLSSASRAVETRNDKRPAAADLPIRDSIEQFAAAVFYLFRDDYYHLDSTAPGIVEVIVGKNRGNVIGTIQLAFMKPIGRMENLVTAK